MTIINIIIVGVGMVLLVLFILLKLTKVPKQVYKSKTVYSDHKERPEKALYSSKYGLVGKPDFILHTKDGLLPLDIKYSKRPNQPYFSHVMQLISYCLLVEEERGEKPKYGFIQYKGGKAFYVPYTEKMKSFLIKTMQEMRGYIDLREGPKIVRKRRCRKCGYEKECFGG